MKFIKLTQIEVLTPVIVAVDQISAVYEQADGSTVVAATYGDFCVAESVDIVWGKLNGVKKEVSRHKWEVLFMDKGKLEFHSGHDTYSQAAIKKSELDSYGLRAVIATNKEDESWNGLV